MKTMRRTFRLGGYREWTVPPDLDHVVEAVWTFRRRRERVAAEDAAAEAASGEGAAGEGGAGRGVAGHRVLPHAGASLCFHSLRASDGRCQDGDVIVIGPIRSARVFAPIPGRHIEAVRLKPEWMRSVLGIDGAEHGDVIEGMASLDVAADGSVLRLRDRLFGTRRPQEAVRLILGYLTERIAAARIERSTRIAHETLERVRTGGPPPTVGSGARPRGLSRLGDELGISERQLRRVVKQETGLGPKRLERVDRMNRAVVTADRLDRPPWSRIALDHGYCDQSHLIREVRAFSGLSPTRLHRERRRQEIEG